MEGVRLFMDVATKGLAQMYDAEKKRFCKKIVRQGADVQAVGRADQGALVALLGLNEAFHYDVAVPFDMPAITTRHIDELPDFTSLSDLGLTLWMTARSHPEFLGSLYKRINLSAALDQFPDARDGSTKALSWFLTGLSEIRLSDGEEPDQLDELAFMVRQMLFVNYGGFGVFRHAMRGKLLNRAAVRYGAFQDQVFGMYAFSRYSRAFHDEPSLEIAARCLKRMIDNQGELGQWWHSFEKSAGQVARKYPVRSVHQHALAPMVLYEIGDQVGLDISDAVEYGLLWVRGDNELNVDLLDRERKVLWEGIFDTKYNTYSKEWSVSKGLRPQWAKKRTLTISWECRPEELGWLLYALSGHCG